MNYQPIQPIFVLYHANCADGFGAAWSAWKFYNSRATYIPVSYGKPVPEMPDGSRVFIVDFSFPREVLMQLSLRCTVTVIDHHATAQEALKGLDFALFDMTKSGAVMTWEYFHPQELAPEMLLYVQDRDLWQWKLPGSQVINAGLWRGTLRNFEAWEYLHQTWEKESKERLVQAGESIAFSDGLMVESLCKHPHWMRVLNFTVPAVNSPVLQSEIGHRLLQLNEAAPFAVIYMTLDDGSMAYSLRAREDDFDVSVVAKEFGGGGHRAAAGFSRAERFEIVEKKKGGR